MIKEPSNLVYKSKLTGNLFNTLISKHSPSFLLLLLSLKICLFFLFFFSENNPKDFLTQKFKNHSVAAGEVKPLDTKFLHLNPRNEKLLRNHEAAFFNKTASDDAIIKFLLFSFSLFFFYCF